MQCARRDDETGTHLALEGMFDAQTVVGVRPIFAEVVARKPERVLVDLSGVTLIDSSGIGVLLALFKGVRSGGGDARIAGAQEQPLMVIKLLKLEEFFRLEAVSPGASPS